MGIIKPCFPPARNEKALIWLVGVYVGFVWSNPTDIDVDKFFGFLSFKYKQEGSRAIGRIQGL